MDQPVLETPRLRLRPFALTDAADVQRLAGDAEVAGTTLNLPHPYLDGVAEEWIASHGPAWVAGTRVTFAIVTKSDELRGAISLHLTARHRRAELGYWVGRAWWGQGFATEAAKHVMAFAFASLDVNRVQASHLTRNPASGRVMLKCGMAFEGVHREYFMRNGRFEDIARYARLRGDT